MKILFLYLVAFRGTGGIEKFNRAFIRALSVISLREKWQLHINSVYDTDYDRRYLETGSFKGFDQKKIRAVLGSLPELIQSEVIILGHINLHTVGRMIKFFFPHKKIILLAHGIEVWRKPSAGELQFLRQVDNIWSVSDFTKNKILHNTQCNASKIKVLPNTLDPYFALPVRFEKPTYLQQRYGLSENTKVILTVARLSSVEKYKGYDRVIEAMATVRKQFPDCRYILAGKCDPKEAARLQELMVQNGVENEVVMTGFVKDEELIDHYLLTDVFIMPSKKEGFGIVFIEALACGVPVIAGNQDGSVEAVKNGELGMLINPDDTTDISRALVSVLKQGNHLPPAELQKQVVDNFGFEHFTNRLFNNLKKMENHRG